MNLHRFLKNPTFIQTQESRTGQKPLSDVTDMEKLISMDMAEKLRGYYAAVRLRDDLETETSEYNARLFLYLLYQPFPLHLSSPIGRKR